MEKYLEVLAACPLFRGIEPGELCALLACLNPCVRSCAKGETLFMEGDFMKRIGVVLSGSVQIVKEDYAGRRSIVASVGPAQLFAESFACAGETPLTVSVIAGEKGEILLIDSHRLTHSCANACAFHARLVLNLMQVMARKNLYLNQKVEILSRRSTREKLLSYLSAQSRLQGSREFTIPFDRQALADYLGVERSALSAEISRLRSEGVLESTRSRFHLL